MTISLLQNLEKEVEPGGIIHINILSAEIRDDSESLEIKWPSFVLDNKD